MYMRRFINGLLDIVFPPVCLVCKRRLSSDAVDTAVCPGCWGAIRKNIPPFCYSCGRHLDVKRSAKNICQSCMKHPLHFDRAVSPCRYDGTVKELIHAFKYGNKPHLGRTLSRLMIRFIEEYDIYVDVIDAVIPMPLHSARLREREFNQAAVLGGHIAQRFNKTMLPETLRRKHMTKTQTGLETPERFSTVRGGFEIREPGPIAGKNILLVDDVLTTGATASEAAITLKKNGARVVLVITAAC
jgi:ComF family protein